MRRLLILFLSPLVAVAVSCSGKGSTMQVEEGPLVYVAMGNSITFYPGHGAIHRYAAMLEEDFGVEVEMRNHTVGGQRTDHFLDRLQNDDELRSDLAEADVITLLIPNEEWAEPGSTAIGSGGRNPADCGGDDNEQCLRDMINYYKSHVDAIFEELVAVADPSEKLIRVQDFYMFPTNVYTEETFDNVYPYWAEAQHYVEDVASEYGIPVAQVFDDFMGPDGTENPEVAGLVTGDGVHPTADGAQRIADLIHDLGYDLAAR
jgi:lysophospholipase L1-like esterase